MTNMTNFKNFALLAFCLLLALTGAFAQTAAPVTVERDVVLTVGTAYNQNGTPKATVDVGAFYQVSDSAYMGVAVDLAFKKNAQPGMTFRPEYVHQVFSVNGHPVSAIVGIGASFVATDPAAILSQLTPVLANVGTNVGYSAATGLTTSFPLYRGIYVAPVVRVIKGSLNDTQVVFGINFATKVKFTRTK